METVKLIELTRIYASLVAEGKISNSEEQWCKFKEKATELVKEDTGNLIDYAMEKFQKYGWLQDGYWHHENWGNEDIAKVLDEMNLPYTEETITFMRRSFSTLFDTSERNEVLKKQVEYLYPFRSELEDMVAYKIGDHYLCVQESNEGMITNSDDANAYEYSITDENYNLIDGGFTVADDIEFAVNSIMEDYHIEGQKIKCDYEELEEKIAEQEEKKVSKMKNNESYEQLHYDRESIIEELNARGYHAIAHTAVKNGVELEGIIFKTEGKISPIIYMDEILEAAREKNDPLDKVISTIIHMITEYARSFEFDTNLIFDRDFVLDNIYIALQKESEEEILKSSTKFAGIEAYLYVRCKRNSLGTYTAKVSENLLEAANVSVKEAWESAKQNTFEETKVATMTEIMCEEMELEYSDEMEDPGLMNIYVITNKSKEKGAACILNEAALSSIGKKCNAELLVILPSSVHEMLVIPYDGVTDISFFNNMVRDVNCMEVSPIDRLTDRAYIVKL